MTGKVEICTANLDFSKCVCSKRPWRYVGGCKVSGLELRFRALCAGYSINAPRIGLEGLRCMEVPV